MKIKLFSTQYLLWEQNYVFEHHQLIIDYDTLYNAQLDKMPKKIESS